MGSEKDQEYMSVLKKDKVRSLVEGYIEILELLMDFVPTEFTLEDSSERVGLIHIVDQIIEVLEFVFGRKQLEKMSTEHYYFRYTVALQWAIKISNKYREIVGDL